MVSRYQVHHGRERPRREWHRCASYPVGIVSHFSQANPSSWDWNTTKIYYAQQCDLDVDATHELSFVNLEDCSPVTTRFQRVDSMDRNEVRAYGEFLGPTIP